MGDGAGRGCLGRWVSVWGGMLLLGLAGCGQTEPPKAPAEGTGFETTLTGYLSKTYDGDHDLCVAAAKEALRRIGLKVTGESDGVFKKSLDVESEDGTSAVVQAVGVTRDSCRVSVKVGYLFGDRDAARRIHSEIEGEIGTRRASVKDLQRKWGGAAAGTTTTVPGR